MRKIIPAIESQGAVTAHVKSNHLLPFDFANVNHKEFKCELY